MQFALALEGSLRDFAAKTEKNLALGVTEGADRFSVIAKLALRADVRAGGLGEKVANTWQAKRYPQKGVSASPAVFLYSKAPIIVSAFEEGVTITHHDGLWLAIPTDNVPMTGKGGKRHKASPQDVEVMFNQDLIIYEGRHGRELLAFVDAVKSRNGRSFRRATNARTGQQSRKAELVLMFVLVPQVTLRKRLNWKRTAAALGLKWQDLIGTGAASRLSS
jgi:hypothetical protein